MKAPVLVTALAVISFSACIGPDAAKEDLIAKARSIHGSPIPRATLLASLDFGRQSGQRLDGSIRNGRMSFSETWQHSSGLTVTAYDSAFVGGKLEIDRRSIDDILNEPSRKSGDFVGDPATGPPREAFQSFSVMDGKKVLFQSVESNHATPR